MADRSLSDPGYLVWGDETADALLLALSRRNERRSKTALELVLPMTRTNIADVLGLSIETVSSTFTKLRQNGVLISNNASPLRSAILTSDSVVGRWLRQSSDMSPSTPAPGGSSPDDPGPGITGEPAPMDCASYIPPLEACSARGSPVIDKTGIDAEHGDAGIELLAQVKAQRADLLVMGAYGHTRLRQFFLGGVPKHILASMTCPVLLSH